MALKATELRIGNLFIGYDDKIFEWSLNEFSLLDKNIALDEIIRETIPLTEEWLFKIPSFQQGKHIIQINGTSELWLLSTGKWYIAGVDCPNENYATEVNIKDVHQLQNLYFALTGEELTITSPASTFS